MQNQTKQPMSDQNTNNPSEKKNPLKRFFTLGEVGGYFFRKKDPNRPNNINIRMMHGVNKFSIVIFIAGVIYIVFKLVIKPLL
jgi:hypothetical protein